MRHRETIHQPVAADAREGNGAVHGVVLQALDAEIERLSPALGEFLVVLAPLVERELRRSWARSAATVTEPVRPRWWKKAFTLTLGMGARPGPRLSGLDIWTSVLDVKKPARRGRAGLGRADMESATIDFFLAKTC
ncbi:MAG: hypothetical protein AAB403_20945 [Planctomycetota bacterium]